LYPIQDGCGKRQDGSPGKKAPDRNGKDSVREGIA
jgi:hypothetical protein